jgi:hypothetical protein
VLGGGDRPDRRVPPSRPRPRCSAPADYIGGRTRSLQQTDGIWLNTGAQYVSTDRVKVVELADAVGARLLRDDNLEEYWRGLYPSHPDTRTEIESCIERITSEQMHRRPATLPELDDQPFDQWLGEVSPDTSFRPLVPDHELRLCRNLTLWRLWLWGDQRSTRGSTSRCPGTPRRCVFDGEQRVHQTLARAIGGLAPL